jgi:hypothetical protein
MLTLLKAGSQTPELPEHQSEPGKGEGKREKIIAEKIL